MQQTNNLGRGRVPRYEHPTLCSNGLHLTFPPQHTNAAYQPMKGQKSSLSREPGQLFQSCLGMCLTEAEHGGLRQLWAIFYIIIASRSPKSTRESVQQGTDLPSAKETGMVTKARLLRDQLRVPAHQSGAKRAPEGLPSHIFLLAHSTRNRHRLTPGRSIMDGLSQGARRRRNAR
jgi:hypothetical protein